MGRRLAIYVPIHGADLRKQAFLMKKGCGCHLLQCRFESFFSDD
jgi:hypothetical protein